MHFRPDSHLLRCLSCFVPLGCPACGKPSFDGTPGMFCAECLESLPFIQPPYCSGCGGAMDGILDVCPKCLHQPPRPWKQAYALLRMEDLGRSAVLQLKYKARPDFARSLGKLLGDKLRRELTAHIDFIVPVPLHWTRILQRGYNQAELVCEGISAAAGIPVFPALKRCKRTKQQAKLTREERILNLTGAFSPNHSTKWKKHAILIVDDVLTTGTTLATAAATLLDAGASEVYAASLARR